MEGEHEIVDGDQVIVEEIVDEGEVCGFDRSFTWQWIWWFKVYDESQVYGEEELYLDASTLDVDNLPPGEYFQLPGMLWLVVFYFFMLQFQMVNLSLQVKRNQCLLPAIKTKGWEWFDSSLVM